MDISIKKIAVAYLLSISWSMPLLGMEHRHPAQAVSLYAHLNIEPNATAQEIQAAYKTLEDKQIESKSVDLERFFKVAEAYKILSDEEIRRLYDSNGYPAALFRLGQKERLPDQIARNVEAARELLQHHLTEVKAYDPVEFKAKIEEANNYYQANLFMGTSELWYVLRDTLAGNYYKLISYLIGIKYDSAQICEHINRGLCFASQNSTIRKELIKFKTRLSPEEDSKKSHVSQKSEPNIFKNYKVDPIILSEMHTNKNRIVALIKRTDYVSPKMFYETVCKCSDDVRKYDSIMHVFKNDPAFVRARYRCGDLTYRAAQQLFKMSEGDVWFCYGLHHTKVLFKKALEHIVFLGNTSKQRITKDDVEREMNILQPHLNYLYKEGSHLRAFFNNPVVDLDICKDVCDVMLDEIEKLDPETQHSALDSIMCLVERYVSENRYDYLLSIGYKVLTKLGKFATKGDDRFQKLKDYMLKIEPLQFFEARIDFLAKHEANMQSDVLADSIMQNYFSVSSLMPYSVHEMFGDILFAYLRLEREAQFDKMYALAKHCVAFDQWPRHIKEHRLLPTMQNFIARYEKLKAEGRIK